METAEEEENLCRAPTLTWKNQRRTNLIFGPRFLFNVGRRALDTGGSLLSTRLWFLMCGTLPLPLPKVFFHSTPCLSVLLPTPPCASACAVFQVFCVTLVHRSMEQL